MCLMSGVPAVAGSWTEKNAGGQQGLHRKVWWEFEKVGGEEAEMWGGHLSGDCFVLHICLFWSSCGRLLRRLPVSPCVQFTPQERLKIGFLINSVLQENKMRQRHEELRLQREKMTAHMVRRPQTRRQKNFWLALCAAERKESPFFPISTRTSAVSLQELTCPRTILCFPQTERVFGRGAEAQWGSESVSRDLRCDRHSGQSRLTWKIRIHRQQFTKTKSLTCWRPCLPKVVEQDFNAGFSELPSMMVARIHKLFKRRPRSVLHLVFSLSASRDSIQVAHRALYFFSFF